jgi:hypothetical protein
MERVEERVDAHAAAIPPEYACAVDAIIARLEHQADAIADCSVERYHDEIIDYRSIRAATQSDVRTMAAGFLQEVLEAIRRGSPIESSHLESFRNSGARRVYQGVSLEALLRAYRIWAQVVWSYVDEAAVTPTEREAALWMVRQLLTHVDVASTLVAQAYLDALAGVPTEGDVLRLDELEALLGDHASSGAHLRPEIRELLESTESFSVVIVQARDPLTMGRAPSTELVAEIRRHLRPQDSIVLIGIRESEAIAIYPRCTLAESYLVEEQASALARDLVSFAVGIGHQHSGREAIARSYAEAREAVAIALASSGPVRAISFADVLLTDVVSASRHAQTLLEETIAPLAAYDELRNASLVATLRAYFDSGFSLTRSGTALHVHPNTVMYRLSRIAQLTGRDPLKPRDFLLLLLGLQLFDLSGPGDAGDVPAASAADARQRVTSG